MYQKIYSQLALIYSHLMRSIDYDKWADYLFQISQEIKSKRIFALELACGLGNIASKILNKFSFYVASDLSISMLKQIDNKHLHRVACDMISLPFKQKFNFVFSTFDSINYLTTKERIKKLLHEVDLCLTQEGIFTFDVSLEANSIKYQRYLNRSGQVNGISYKQKSRYSEEERIHYNIFEITLADGQKIKEVHKQKIYHFEDYFKIIEKSNFYVQNCYDAFTFKNATSQSERAQFILKKKINHADI